MYEQSDWLIGVMRVMLYSLFIVPEQMSLAMESSSIPAGAGSIMNDREKGGYQGDIALCHSK
ncbi:hypothetical protein GCM10007416_17620 [Kroppenstedtia guangzhouensis]|jgi:hypothetical protein|uniref:Uncharacterized protein n=1 Tax=Kroppenstedtia guangzhouensis TaxID=1274356 RepID=A0ABQ1GJP2_9BACL|nr:hypothetical protein GCM10007416_17620 [Kroppenstedtia guangzhouensis]